MPFAQEFVRAKQARLVLLAGRGAGKTHAIQARMKWLTTRYPKFRYMYVTPTEGQGSQVYNEMRADREFARFIDEKKSNSRRHPLIILKNTAQIIFRSFQRPSLLVSTGEDEICDDEIQDHVYTEDAVIRYQMPMLNRRPSPAGGRGVFVFAGQFPRDEWLKKRFWDHGIPTLLETGEENPMYQPDRFRSWMVPVWDGFSFQTDEGKEELNRIKADTKPQLWKHQYECKPYETEYAAFAAEQLDAISINAGTQRNTGRPLEVYNNSIPGEKYIVSVDIGRITDPTTILAGDLHGNILFEKTLALGTPYAVAARETMLVASRYNGALVVVDTTGGGGGGHVEKDSIVEVYQTMADAFHLTLKKVIQAPPVKRRMCDNLSVAIQQGLVRVPPGCKKLLWQLRQYEYVLVVRRGPAYYSFQGPNGHDDDFVSCMMMYYEAITRGWAANVGVAGAGTGAY